MLIIFLLNDSNLAMFPVVLVSNALEMVSCTCLFIYGIRLNQIQLPIRSYSVRIKYTCLLSKLPQTRANTALSDFFGKIVPGSPPDTLSWSCWRKIFDIKVILLRLDRFRVVSQPGTWPGLTFDPDRMKCLEVKAKDHVPGWEHGGNW